MYQVYVRNYYSVYEIPKCEYSVNIKYELKCKTVLALIKRFEKHYFISVKFNNWVDNVDIYLHLIYPFCYALSLKK